MYPKFISLMCIFIAIPSIAREIADLPPAWAESHYGACYSSLENGMSDIYGPDYKSDENIVQQTMKYGSAEMVVSADHTSGSNASRAIFEKRNGSNWCVVLTSPPVASLTPAKVTNAYPRPPRWTTLTQAAPGYPETEVVYVWNRLDAVYAAARCYLISGRERKKIDCVNAYR